MVPTKTPVSFSCSRIIGQPLVFRLVVGSMWTAAVMLAPGMTIVIHGDGACDTADSPSTTPPNRKPCHTPARPRAIWLTLPRNPSLRRPAGGGLVQIGHIAGRSSHQGRLRDRECRGRGLMRGDLRHHGRARGGEHLAEGGHEAARLPQTREFPGDRSDAE